MIFFNKPKLRLELFPGKTPVIALFITRGRRVMQLRAWNQSHYSTRLATEYSKVFSELTGIKLVNNLPDEN